MRHPTFAVLEAVCAAYAVTLAQLLNRTRGLRPWARARGIAMALLRERGLVLADIGLLFGRDHSTVHTAVERAIPELENPTPELLEARRLLAEAERAPFSCSACGEPRTPRHFGIVCPSCGGAWVGVEPHRSAAPG